MPSFHQVLSAVHSALIPVLSVLQQELPAVSAARQASHPASLTAHPDSAVSHPFHQWHSVYPEVPAYTAPALQSSRRAPADFHYNFSVPEKESHT